MKERAFKCTHRKEMGREEDDVKRCYLNVSMETKKKEHCDGKETKKAAERKERNEKGMKKESFLDLLQHSLSFLPLGYSLSFCRGLYILSAV